MDKKYILTPEDLEGRSFHIDNGFPFSHPQGNLRHYISLAEAVEIVPAIRVEFALRMEAAEDDIMLELAEKYLEKQRDESETERQLQSREDSEKLRTL